MTNNDSKIHRPILISHKPTLISIIVANRRNKTTNRKQLKYLMDYNRKLNLHYSIYRDPCLNKYAMKRGRRRSIYAGKCKLFIIIT